MFTLFIAHTGTAFWHHFHPWITQNMDLEALPHLGTQNHGKITRRYPKWASKELQNVPKT